MEAKFVRILYLVCALALVVASRFCTPMVIGIAGVVLSLVMYLIGKTRYFAIGVAILSVLTAINFMPSLALLAPLMMILLGEGLRVLFRNAGHEMIFFGLGSVVALVFVMFYTGTFDPLICAIALLALLLLRSILKSRDDGSLLSLIGVAMVIFLFLELDFPVDIWIFVFALLLCAAFGYFAYKARTIDLSGVFSAVLFGILLITFTRSISWFLAVMAFFIVGSLFTKFKYTKKTELGVAQSKGGKRGYMNAFANAGVGVVASILFGVTGNPIFAALFLGSIATATGDTLASEIGVIGKNPRMITTMKPCKAGQNGGVSILGELACLAGALLIGIIGFVAGIASLPVCLIAVFAGFIGTNLDSLIGALFENRGWIGNAGTNLIATLLGGLVALGLCVLLGL